MSYIIKIPCASTRGDAYARANSVPESEGVWVILPPLVVVRASDGRYAYRVTEDVAIFPTLHVAKLWKRRRVAHMRKLKRPSAPMRIMNLAEARLPMGEYLR